MALTGFLATEKSELSSNCFNKMEMRLAESSGAVSSIFSLQTRYCMWLIRAITLKLHSGGSEFTAYSVLQDINSVLLPLKCRE